MDPHARYRVRMVAGVLLAIVGLVVSRIAFDHGKDWGADLAQLYVSGWMLREGRNIYDMAVQHQGYLDHIGYVTTWGHFYPPAPAVVMLPVTLISYPVARELYFMVLAAGMFLCLWRFLAVFAPQWDRSMRVLVIGLVTCAATTRWSFKVAQPGTLVLGLYALFLTELKTRRSWVAFLAASAITSIKVTFGMPFVLMAAAQRRWKLAGAIVGLSVLLNVIGLYGMGGPEILADYKANMAQFERPDELNYPDPRGKSSMSRTDWPYLLNTIDPSDHARSRLIGHALTLASLGWLAWLVWRARSRVREDDAILALGGAVAAVSMLAVYHHHYDLNIMLAPAIGMLARPELRRERLAWAYILPVGLYAGVYPFDKVFRLVRALVGQPAAIVITKPLACVVCILALVSAGLLFRRVVAARAAAPVARPAMPRVSDQPV